MRAISELRWRLTDIFIATTSLTLFVEVVLVVRDITGVVASNKVGHPVLQNIPYGRTAAVSLDSAFNLVPAAMSDATFQRRQ